MFIQTTTWIQLLWTSFVYYQIVSDLAVFIFLTLLVDFQKPRLLDMRFQMILERQTDGQIYNYIDRLTMALRDSVIPFLSIAPNHFRANSSSPRIT